MKMPTLAHSAVARRSLLVASALFLAACSGEVTSPAASSMRPLDATKALSGIVDGVYTFTVNPWVDASLALGQSHLDIPAGAICDLSSSGYGPSTWNSSCVTETRAVHITAIVRNASTNNPSVEFAPALRFSPTKAVHLYLYVTNAATLSNMAVVKYCGPFYATCVDESLSDASLQTTINTTAGLVFRRIKHFSGYVVAE